MAPASEDPPRAHRTGRLTRTRPACTRAGSTDRSPRQLALLEQRNWFQRTFLDWHVPWWVGPLLFVVIGLGWVACFFFTLIYGVKFAYDAARGAPALVCLPA